MAAFILHLISESSLSLACTAFSLAVYFEIMVVISQENAYEKARRQNIIRNQRVATSMGIRTMGAMIRAISPKPRFSRHGLLTRLISHQKDDLLEDNPVWLRVKKVFCRIAQLSDILFADGLQFAEASGCSGRSQGDFNHRY